LADWTNGVNLAVSHYVSMIQIMLDPADLQPGPASCDAKPEVDH